MSTTATPAQVRKRIDLAVLTDRWATVLAAFVVSRAIAVASLVLGASESLDKITFGALASWDSAWYLVITVHGYGPPPVAGQQTPWPFFPLLPGLTRALTEVGLPAKAALILITNLTFLLALAGVYTLARRHTTSTGSAMAVWLVALFPMGVVFSMGYPSSIFLAATTWCIVALEQRHDGRAALLALLATGVRPNGALLLAAIVVGLVVKERAWRRAAVIAAPSAAFLVVWCLLLWRWTDDPFVFWTAKGAWDEVTIFEILGGPKNGEIPHVIAGGLGIAALVAWGRRMSFTWALYTVLYLAPVLLLGVVGLGRYINECFPIFIASGAALARWPAWTRTALLVCSAAVMGLFGVMVARYRYLP
ncbi:MAG: hypothetical protein AB7L13_03625 [Acidimicrobiia bacterium]